jgi:hypothetical protein
MPSSSQECRHKALGLIQLAETAASADDKKRFANLAETWLKLAGDLEEIDTLLQTQAEREKAG